MYTINFIKVKYDFVIDMLFKLISCLMYTFAEKGMLNKWMSFKCIYPYN